MNQKFISHRCNELLTHNKNNYPPVFIRKIIKLDIRNPLYCIKGWNLYHTKENLDYNVIYPVNVGEIIFCPFCGKKLV